MRPLQLDIDADSPDCLSDLVLDRLRTGELGAVRRLEIQAHLGTCPRCTARRDELDKEAVDFPEQQWISGLARQAAGRARSPVWRRFSVSAGVLAAAAAVVLALQPARSPELRAKGGGSLELHVRRASGEIGPLGQGERLSPGDAVRFSVHAVRAGHLAIVGIDSAEVVSLYHPLSGPLVPISPGDTLVEGSIVLDDTLGAERMIALICDQPLARTKVLEAARAALARAAGDPREVGDLGLVCRQHSILVEKSR